MALLEAECISQSCSMTNPGFRNESEAQSQFSLRNTEKKHTFSFSTGLQLRITPGQCLSDTLQLWYGGVITQQIQAHFFNDRLVTAQSRAQKMAPLDPVIMVKIGHRDTLTSLLTLQQKSECRENLGVKMTRTRVGAKEKATGPPGTKKQLH